MSKGIFKAHGKTKLIPCLNGYFKKIGRGLHISACISNKNYDEDEGVVKKEPEIWFDHVYGHEEYPG
jgi:hypothetical protein